jgi:mannosyltransferase OCH1-like enzyme
MSNQFRLTVDQHPPHSPYLAFYPSRSSKHRAPGLARPPRVGRRELKLRCAGFAVLLSGTLASLLFTYLYVDRSTWLPILKQVPLPHFVHCAAVISTDPHPVIIPLEGDSISQLQRNSNARRAKQIQAPQLIEQHTISRLPSSHSSSLITPLIHQSWKTPSLPAKLRYMADTWRLTYPNHTYVLWTDADNLMLVERLYPEYVQAYLALPREIYRADFVRPLYMHAFGGIYVDLDTDSIRSLEGTFASLASTANSTGVAYLAQMGTNTSFEHSIPNAFMASTPAHPFWLHYLQLCQRYADIQRSSLNAISPEWITGPVILKEAVSTYLNSTVSRALNILAPNVVYPYDWEHADDRTNCLCHARERTFDRLKCRAVVTSLGASAVAYWNKSWRDKSFLDLVFGGED